MTTWYYFHMVPDLSIYLILASLVLGMNVIPAFMPPTWTALAFFYIQYHLNFLAVVVIGAICATSGRIVLYSLAKNQLRNFFSQKYLKNYDALGLYLRGNNKMTIPLLLTYAFLPLPSNELFVMAGLTRLNLKPIALAFLLGGFTTDIFWISLAKYAHTRLSTIFSHHVNNIITIVIELVGIAAIILIGRIEWGKILPKPKAMK